jgi:hypothetical protein
MAISKNSARIQITLNTDKEREKVIVDFLNTCMNEKNTIKEILYNYIVSNSDSKLLTVTHSKVTQSDAQLLKVTHSEITQGEEKLLEVSDLELNEMEELNKFI